MKTAILNSEMPEGRDYAPCGESLPPSDDLFYQSRGYIAECYRAGEILAA